MQRLVGFAETVNKTTVKLLPICKGTLNIVCVAEAGKAEAQPCLAEVRCALGCSWADVEAAGHSDTAPSFQHLVPHLPEGPGVLPLEDTDEINPNRKWATVNLHWSRKREDWDCGRM